MVTSRECRSLGAPVRIIKYWAFQTSVSGVNYFFWSTTIISPDQRQLLLTSSAGAKRHRGRGAKPARVWGFPSFLSF
jgi:hypothetical protein